MFFSFSLILFAFISLSFLSVFGFILIVLELMGFSVFTISFFNLLAFTSKEIFDLSSLLLGIILLEIIGFEFCLGNSFFVCISVLLYL